MHQESANSITFLREPSVLSRLGVSSATLWRWVRDGRFPRARRLGPNSVAWVASDVDAWLATRPEVAGHTDDDMTVVTHD